MGDKKKGFLWSAVGTGSLLFTLASYSNYHTKRKSHEEAVEAYSNATSNFNIYKSAVQTELENKNGALTQLAISSTVYTSAVLINYLSFRSKKDTRAGSNKINGSVNPLGQVAITFSF